MLQNAVLKKSVNAMVKGAQSLSAVCKQISGMQRVEYEEGKFVSPLLVMQSLGVHVLKNKYTPKDITLAWSERLKFGGLIHVLKNVPVNSDCKLMGQKKNLRLYEKTVVDGNDEFVPVSVYMPVPVVNGTERQSGDLSSVWDVRTLMKGLLQSVHIEKELAKADASKAAYEKLTESVCYVNIAKKDMKANYVPVVYRDGKWVRPLKKEKVA